MFEYQSDAEKLKAVREVLDAIAFLLQEKKEILNNVEISRLLLLIASGIANPNPDKI